MNFLNDIKYALFPEIIISMLIIINCFIAFLVPKDKQDKVFFLNFFGIAAALGSLGIVASQNFHYAFYNSFLSDNLTLIFSTLILLGCFITLLMTKQYIKLWSDYKTEFYTLLLTSILGALLLCGAVDLVMIFIAIETLSIPAYILSGFSKSDKFSNEAALKYFVLGGVSSAIFLYGLSILYGIAGSTNLVNIHQFTANMPDNALLILSMLFILVGLFFKLTAFPLHVWAPDVYTGAPLPVAAFLSVVSKMAGFAILIRILINIYSHNVFAAIFIGMVAILTMTIGNLGAVTQTDLRRIMAYSSIAQAGYILAGIAVLNKIGMSASIFYIVCYLFMNFGAWSAIELFINKTGKTAIKDLQGLAYSNMPLSLSFTLCLLSLAGLPLTAGFWGKFYLFSSIFLAGPLFLPLFIIALINTVVGLYYYTKIIKSMFVKPLNGCSFNHNILKKPIYINTALLFCCIFVIIIGFVASPFITITQKTVISVSNSDNSIKRLNYFYKK
ncbi:MAG: NADH-quinone oxidoreductase subunit N [Candidatus Gastranaerophilaceae bacterium]|jgi:NAD(P)H-quinone oxidoreductase subunit 2